MSCQLWKAVKSFTPDGLGRRARRLDATQPDATFRTAVLATGSRSALPRGCTSSVDLTRPWWRPCTGNLFSFSSELPIPRSDIDTSQAKDFRQRCQPILPSIQMHATQLSLSHLQRKSNRSRSSPQVLVLSETERKNPVCGIWFELPIKSRAELYKGRSARFSVH